MTSSPPTTSRSRRNAPELVWHTSIHHRYQRFCFAQSGAASASPRPCESCLAIPLIIQDYRPLDEARSFFVPSMLFAPFRPRTSHVMGFGSILPDRTSPKHVQKIWNGRAQSCPHRVERKTARRMQTHRSLLSLRQWLSARPPVVIAETPAGSPSLAIE